MSSIKTITLNQYSFQSVNKSIVFCLNHISHTNLVHNVIGLKHLILLYLATLVLLFAVGLIHFHHRISNIMNTEWVLIYQLLSLQHLEVLQLHLSQDKVMWQLRVLRNGVAGAPWVFNSEEVFSWQQGQLWKLFHRYCSRSMVFQDVYIFLFLILETIE